MQVGSMLTLAAREGSTTRESAGGHRRGLSLLDDGIYSRVEAAVILLEDAAHRPDGRTFGADAPIASFVAHGGDEAAAVEAAFAAAREIAQSRTALPLPSEQVERVILARSVQERAYKGRPGAVRSIELALVEGPLGRKAALLETRDCGSSGIRRVEVSVGDLDLPSSAADALRAEVEAAALAAVAPVATALVLVHESRVEAVRAQLAAAGVPAVVLASPDEKPGYPGDADRRAYAGSSRILGVEAAREAAAAVVD